MTSFPWSIPKCSCSPPTDRKKAAVPAKDGGLLFCPRRRAEVRNAARPRGWKTVPRPREKRTPEGPIAGGRGRKRRSAIHARGKDEPGGAKSGARKNLNRRRGRRGWRRETSLQRRARCREARGAGRARCEERSEDKKEGKPRKDVTLKRSFAARQTPPISASGAFASEDRMFPPCMLTRKSASDARAGERLRPVCAMFRARAPSRGFFLSASGTRRHVQVLPHTTFRASARPAPRRCRSKDRCTARDDSRKTAAPPRAGCNPPSTTLRLFRAMPAQTKKPEATIVASGRHIVFGTTSEN